MIEFALQKTEYHVEKAFSFLLEMMESLGNLKRHKIFASMEFSFKNRVNFFCRL
jgi:hypothetical protein